MAREIYVAKGDAAQGWRSTYQYTVMIFSRIVIILYIHAGPQSTPITIARSSPGKISFSFLQKKIKKSNLSEYDYNCFESNSHQSFLTTFIRDRIKTVAKSEFTALYNENIAAIPEFVAPPAQSLE